MRVLEVNPYLTDNRGGIERRVLGLARELARRGHEVTAVTCAREGEGGGAAPDRLEGGVKLRKLEEGLFEAGPYDPPFLSARGLARAVEGLSPDVIDIHYMWTPDYMRSFRKLKKGTPVVYTLHNSFGFGEGIDGRAAYISDSVFKLFLRNCDIAVCLSDFIRRDVRAQGIKADKLRVVPGAVDRTTDGELAALRAAQGRLKGPYAVFVGRLERTKGLGVLVDAVRGLKAPLTFVLLGRGPDLEALREEARDFGIGDRVVFEGFVGEERKRQLTAQADLFVYPATFEPSGLALLEAMDLGCPVLSTSVGGVPEVVGEAGRLVAPGDVDALRQALEEMARDGAARRALGAQGRARASRFSWSATAGGMEAAFEAARKAP